MSNDEDEPVHCYRVTLPSYAEARRIRGLAPHVPDHPVDETPLRTILHGAFGPPCVQCGGVSEVLCDFPLGAEGRTCDLALCLECAPTTGRDENYCREHAEHGPGMLLFLPRPPATPPAPVKRQRAQPLPRKPPEPNRWRVLQADGTALGCWMSEHEAHFRARKVGGTVETWDEFVRQHRALHPLASRRKR